MRFIISRRTRCSSNRRSGSAKWRCSRGDNNGVDDDECIFDGGSCMGKKLQMSEEHTEDKRLVAVKDQPADIEKRLIRTLRPDIFVLLPHAHMIESFNRGRKIHDGAITIDLQRLAQEKMEMDALHIPHSNESMGPVPRGRHVESSPFPAGTVAAHPWRGSWVLSAMLGAAHQKLRKLMHTRFIVRWFFPLSTLAIVYFGCRSMKTLQRRARARELCSEDSSLCTVDNVARPSIIQWHFLEIASADFPPYAIVLNSQDVKQDLIWSAKFELSYTRHKGCFGIRLKVHSLKFGVSKCMRKTSVLGHFVHKMEMKVEPPESWASIKRSFWLSDTKPAVAPHVRTTEQITTNMSTSFNVGVDGSSGINLAASRDRAYSREIENYKWIASVDSDETVTWTWSLEGPWKRGYSCFGSPQQLPLSGNLLHFGEKNLQLSATWFLQGEAPPPPSHAAGVPDTWHLRVTMHTAFFGKYARVLRLTKNKFLTWHFSSILQVKKDVSSLS